MNSIELLYGMESVRLHASDKLLGEPTEVRHGIGVEFYFARGGAALYMIGAKTYQVDDGDIIYIPEGITHKMLESDEGHEANGFSCPGYFLPERVKESLREMGPVIRIQPIGEYIGEITDRIRREAREPRLFSDELMRCYVNELAIHISRSRNEYAFDSSVSPAVTIALGFVRDHAQERITLADAAEAADVSVAYLSRRFKTDVGIGFSEYLSRQRLERATRMLREHPEMSVTEVAFSCGFNDSNYFSDKFKREIGMSPLKYRKEG